MKNKSKLFVTTLKYAKFICICFFNNFFQSKILLTKDSRESTDEYFQFNPARG